MIISYFPKKKQFLKEKKFEKKIFHKNFFKKKYFITEVQKYLYPLYYIDISFVYIMVIYGNLW